MTVKIVTDSTSDLPATLVDELDINVVPLSINFGNDNYIDGVDLDANEFYRKLGSSPSLPTTSQPPPSAFIDVYSKLAKATDEIVSIHISPKLSGTYNSALLAKEAINGRCRIEVIDSMQASMGLGLIVIKAAKAAQSGASLDEVLKVVNRVIPRVHLFGMVDTLEYLHKGGRIGKAQALMGTLLNIKPLIGCIDGEVHPRGKARTRKKAMAQLYEMVQGIGNYEEMTISYSTGQEEAVAFTEQLDSIFDKDKILQSRIGPVIGTYLGPGAVAIGILEKASNSPDIGV